MKDKIRMMWRYCYLVKEVARLSELANFSKSAIWEAEFNEARMELEGLEDIVFKFAEELWMHYDVRENLFVEN